MYTAAQEADMTGIVFYMGIFVAIFVSISVAVSLCFFSMAISAEDKGRARRLADARMNARLLRFNL